MVTKPFRPLLAAKAPTDLKQLQYPVIVSPKLDGIRCLITEQGAVSRQLKPIPNDYIRKFLSAPRFVGLDGELITYTDGIPDDFNTIQSKVMTKDRLTKDFKFFVFDDFSEPQSTYENRLFDVTKTLRFSILSRIEPLEHFRADCWEQVIVAEKNYLSRGYEGAMIRDPNGLYKHGRSTPKAGPLWKLKRFQDAEAIIVGFTERMHNANEATTDALGHTERSSHKENLVPTGTLGAFKCVWADEAHWGQSDSPSWNKDKEFEVGTGFTEDQRNAFWEWQALHQWSPITVTFQELTADGKPRFPVFKGFRPEVAQ